MLISQTGYVVNIAKIKRIKHLQRVKFIPKCHNISELSHIGIR